MLPLTNIKLLLIVFVVVTKILCFCEESYIVICDNLMDVKNNDSSRWKHVLIGSSQFQQEPPSEILKQSTFFALLRTKSLTIINRISTVRSPLASSLTNQIEYLNLYENNIRSIEDYTFSNFQHLRELYLENNKLEYLGRSLFRNTTLDVVNLSRNRIESITTCFLESNIKWILINRNRLNYIKIRAFPKTLQQLNLDHNFLDNLEAEVFEDLHDLKELSLQHNRLSTIPDVSSLKSIVFFHFAFNNIQSVNYRFDQHLKLEYVDLSSNSISKISLNIFGIIGGTPPMVILAFNRLTDLNFDNPTNKTDLVLYGNPWNCDCLFKIERTIIENKHFKTCDLRSFRNGKLPVCIENGKCGQRKIPKSDIEKYVRVASSCENKSMCNFLL